MISRSLRKKIKLIALWLVGFLIILLLLNHLVKKVSGNITDAFVSPFTGQKLSSLEKVVKSSLEGAKGEYSMAIKNLKTGESYYLNEHEILDSGSLYKLWVMAEAFNQIKKGSLKEEDILSQDIAVLNDKFNIDDENAEFTEGAISMSVKDALKQMITISHNYAALLLTEKIKLSNVANFLKNNGFKESTVGTSGDSPKTTASDIMFFFEKLYKGQLAEGDYSAEMFDLLANQQLNNKLPKYLPKNIKIAHKTGEIFYLSHDGGIVFSPKGDYIIVVMSKTDSPEGAEDRIAQISEAVYKYFNH